MTTTNPYPEVALLWGDVETDGLNPWTRHRGGNPTVAVYEASHLLEIAVYATDLDLNVLDPAGMHFIVRYTPEQATAMREAASPFVQAMHDKTGLGASSPTRTCRPRWRRSTRP